MAGIQGTVMHRQPRLLLTKPAVVGQSLADLVRRSRGIAARRTTVASSHGVKLIDDAGTVVKDMLLGLSASCPHINILDGLNKVHRPPTPKCPHNACPQMRDPRCSACCIFAHVHELRSAQRCTGKACMQSVCVAVNNDASSAVAVIGGGGSGHEPAQAAFVGPGLLTAAVCGAVFASPSSEAVHAAIAAAAGAPGCLLVIRNYTGDILNFGLAEEVAKAEGYAVERVIVQDDVGVLAAGIAGCRGIAGAALVAKVRT
jgi:Dak1 domain